MPIYKYKYSKDGEEKEETRDLPDKAALYAYIRSIRGTILSSEEIKAKKSIFETTISIKRVKIRDIISFTKNLAVMIEAGLSISRALSILRKQTHNKKLAKILGEIEAAVGNGDTLSAALSVHPNEFSNLFVSMVKAGEESGRLAETLREASSQLEKTYLLIKKVQGAMIYPVIVLTLMVILGVVMLVFMVPTLTETFKGLNVELPLPTRIIIAVSDFLRYNAILVLSACVVLAGSVIFYLRTGNGKRFKDFAVLHIPLISPLVKEINSARTARTLSSLISSGVDIVVAIGVASDVMQNSYYKEVLKKAQTAIQEGEPISKVFLDAPDLYPVFVGEMSSVGEETGKLGSMFENIASFYEEEVDRKTKDLSTIIEPFMMIFIGIAVGIFAIAMLAPTYSLVDAIQ